MLTLLFCISCKKECSKSTIHKFSKESFSLINGVLFFQNEKFSGKLSSYDPVNFTSNLIEYCDGKKNGKEIKKYNTNELAEERFYKEGVKTGVHRGWWENGNQKFEYHFNASGEYHGIVKNWYKTGKMFKFFNYRDGREEGSQKMWQSNGKIRANFVTKKGERYGVIGLKKCYTLNSKDESIQ
ncbi:hypothetical protein SAMN04489761_0683 [Tenacibaculum sp. MAR_2009_124]|uniref:toxin-antitoxin system YwqK family antitoxin n=1 Tax=Tenacibaculum sp. MAR_2009_124 TaxID=1250059 RepID=UPI00089AFBDD|nr:hypothetical protein [Tenacibaculum sp. MAR_2009_124]SEB43303.1 hypothetical protein SAMN04489761_0683 [Tenacibaculum sp. MAR_2009_124]